MSTKIQLHYSQALDIDLLEKNVEVWFRRLTVQVVFGKQKDFSQPYEAIVDTGAPVSIIPPAIWQDCEKEIIGQYKIRGLVPKKDAYIDVKIANISCVLFDEHNASGVLAIKAYLSMEPNVPLVLGFEGFLSKAKLYSDFQAKQGYIDI
jgi:hypothetical protein